MAVTILTKVLSAVYIIAGGLKIYPPTDMMTLHMNKQFHALAEYCPLVLVGYRPDGYTYRVALGWIEFLCALLLLFGPNFVKKLSCCVLMTLMAGAVLAMICFQNGITILAPSCCFLAIAYQLMLLSHPDEKKEA